MTNYYHLKICALPNSAEFVSTSRKFSSKKVSSCKSLFGSSSPSTQMNEEEERWRNNDEAWDKLHGYETTSGCPCWDRTSHLCIPKHSGLGLNINFWFLFCCFMCEEEAIDPRIGMAKEKVSSYS